MLNGMEQLTFIIIQMLMLSTTGAIIAFTFDRSLFSLHPLCMAIGFLIFIDEGFFAARFIKTARRPLALRIHVFCQSIGLGITFAGAVVIMYHKYDEGDEHFENWHELIGACVLLLACLQAALGLRLNSLPHTRFTIQTIIQVTALHRNIGTAVLIVSHIALVSGMWQYAHRDPSAALKFVLGFGAPLTLLVTLLMRFKESRKVITALGGSAGDFPISIG